jgi:hypothetical protein
MSGPRSTQVNVVEAPFGRRELLAPAPETQSKTDDER